MRTISSRLETDLLKTSVDPLHREVIVYKKYPGKVLTYGEYYLLIEGDATSLFSVGDVVTVSHVAGIEEYTLTAAAFVPASHYTVLNKGVGLGSSWANQDGNNPAYVYKKYSIKERLLKGGIGDITYSVEGNTLNEFKASDVTLKVENGENTYWDDENGTGIFYKKSISGVVDAVSGYTITASELVNFVGSVEGYYIQMTSGDGLTKKYSVEALNTTTGILTLTSEPGDDDVAVGDTFELVIENDYWVQIIYGVKGRVEANERFPVFGGLIYSKDIKYDRTSRIIQLRCVGFYKDFENTLASETAILLQRTVKFHCQPIEYQQGEAKYVKYGTRKLKYEYPANENILGITINSLSGFTHPGMKILKYKKPNWFSYDNGDWTGINADGEETLESIDGHTLDCTFAIDDFPYTNTVEYINVGFDEKEYSILEAEDKGQATIKFDDGKASTIYESFFRIWRCSTEPSGDTQENGSDYTSVERLDPIILLDSTSGGSIYFGSPSRFNSFRLEDVDNSTSITGSWYYSQGIGNATDGWKALTVTNGTTNFTTDGIIKFDIPDDWQQRARVGLNIDHMMYYIKFVPAAGTHSVTAERIYLHTYVKGYTGDYLNLEFYAEKLLPDSETEDIIIRKDDNGDPEIATWECGARAIDLLDNIIQKAGYSLGATYDDSKTSLVHSRAVNFWGKPPFESEPSPPMCMCHTGTYLYIAIKNEVYRIKNDSSHELIYSIPYGFTITDLSYGSTCEEIYGLAFAIGWPKKATDAYAKRDFYYSAPDSYVFAIENPDAATPIIVKNKYDAAQQYSPIDNRFLIRSGWSFYAGVGATNPDVYKCVGYLKTDALKPGYTLWHWFSESLVIPFPHALRVVSFHGADFSTPDLESGVFEYLSMKTHKPSGGTGSDLDVDTTLPAKLAAGYYFFYAIKLGLPNVSWKEAGVQHSIGQRGHTCLWDKTNTVVKSGGGYIDKGFFVQTPPSTLTDNNGAEFRIVDENGDYSNLLAVSEGYYDNGTYVYYRKRLNLLSSCVGKDSINEIIMSTFLEMTTQGNSEITTPKDWVCRNFIESLIVDEDWDNVYDLKAMYHYDNSAATYTAMSFPNTYNLQQNDYLYVSDYRMFSNLFIKGSGAVVGNLTFEYLDDNGSWSTITLNRTMIDSGDIALYWPIFIRHRDGNYDHWDRQADANVGDAAGDCYHFRIKVNTAVTWAITGMGIKRKVIWENMHSDYSAEDYGPVTTEIEYNPDDDYVYGCMFNRYNLQWYVVSIDMAAGRTVTQSNPLTRSQTGFNEQLQPAAFSYNSNDDLVYFVLTDPRFEENNMKLYTITDDSGISIDHQVDIYLGKEYTQKGKLVFNGTTIYGLTGNERNYIWEYDTSVDLRVPVAEWKDISCRTASQHLLQLLGMTMIITPERKVKVIKRSKTFSSDKELTEKWITKIKETKLFKHKYNGIKISWSDMFDGSGKIEIGDLSRGAKALSISNPLVVNSPMAQLIGEGLFPLFNRFKREVSFSIRLLPIFDLLDGINIKLPGGIYPTISSTDIWALNKIVISDKSKEVKIVATEES